MCLKAKRGPVRNGRCRGYARYLLPLFSKKQRQQLYRRLCLLHSLVIPVVTRKIERGHLSPIPGELTPSPVQPPEKRSKSRLRSAPLVAFIEIRRFIFAFRSFATELPIANRIFHLLLPSHGRSTTRESSGARRCLSLAGGERLIR